MKEISWEGLFRRFDDGRGGTGKRFFNGGEASTSPEMGRDDVGHFSVEILATEFEGDS